MNLGFRQTSPAVTGSDGKIIFIVEKIISLPSKKRRAELSTPNLVFFKRVNGWTTPFPYVRGQEGHWVTLITFFSQMKGNMLWGGVVPTHSTSVCICLHLKSYVLLSYWHGGGVVEGGAILTISNSAAENKNKNKIKYNSKNLFLPVPNWTFLLK